MATALNTILATTTTISGATGTNGTNGTTGTAFTSNFKGNNNNGGYGGFGGGNGTDDQEGYAGGYDAYFSSTPNSFILGSGTSVVRTDVGDAPHPSPGYVTITKI